MLNRKGQGGLEYLLTYGWALLLIATVIGVLAFIVMAPASMVVFSSSDPGKIMVKGGAAHGTDVEVKLQNITGGKMEITKVTMPASYASPVTCTLNESPINSGSIIEPSIPVWGGGEIYIQCNGLTESPSGRISIEYTDFADLPRSVGITASGGTATQAALVTFSQAYGGSSAEYGYSVAQTSDGYVIAGAQGTAPEKDIYILKTDSLGNEQWNRTIGSTDVDQGNSVIQTSDGSYVIAGTYNRDIILMKIDSSGNTIWQKTFTGAGAGYFDPGYSVVQTSDGGYAVAGVQTITGTNEQLWLIKTDSSGSKQWDGTFGGSAKEGGYSVIRASGGGYAIAGSTASFGNGEQLYIVKTDSLGNLSCQNNFGGAGADRGNSLVQTADGGFMIAGESFGTSYDVYLVKTYPNCLLEWEKKFGGSGDDRGKSIIKTAGGEFIIAGSTSSQGVGNSDVWLIKTDSGGNEIWSRTFGGPSGDYGYSVAQTSDGGYVAAGYTSSFGNGYQVYLVKTNASGEQ